MARKITFLFAAFVCIGISSYALDRDEITLFDVDGNPVAYIDTADRDLTIYLWDGIPAAYIVGKDIYGFTGEHLGWHQNGIIMDHGGYAVGMTKNAFAGFKKFEPLKGLKKIKPIPNIRKLAPLMPIYKMLWSKNDLRLFLAEGVKH